MKNSSVILLTLVIVAAACKSPKPAATETTQKTDCSTKANITYAADIKNILQQKCANCHNSNNKAGYNFLTIESAIKGAKNGELLGTIKYLKGYPKMPIGAPQLSQEEIDKIECWINNGMK